MLLLALVACTTMIKVETRPPGADVFITNYPPSSSMRPTEYEAQGISPLICAVDYFAWESYYAWAEVPGYPPQVRPIRNELKILPAVGGFFCLPVWIWALGPDDSPVYIDFTPQSSSRSTNR